MGKQHTINDLKKYEQALEKTRQLIFQADPPFFSPGQQQTTFCTCSNSMSMQSKSLGPKLAYFQSHLSFT